MQSGTKDKKTSWIKAFFFVVGIIVAFTMVSPAGSTLLADETGSAVIATAAPDYSSGAHSIVSVEPVDGSRTVSNNLAPTTTSDLTVVAHGECFYRIERYFGDNITKFSSQTPDTAIWQYSTLDDSSDPTGNPTDMVFVNEEKAYVLRNNATTAWIVNPSAESEEGFKIGELDLSAYNDEDGCPEMYSGVIVDDKLFVTLQRMTQNDWPDPWTPNTAYVAVFDTTTDEEIDTGMGNDGKKGIPLEITNLADIQYLVDNHFIYVQGVGMYEKEDSRGGIERIDPDTYQTAVILEEGQPYGNISGLAVISPTLGYFVGYAGWGDNTLYVFDPSQDNPQGTAVAGLENINIGAIVPGPDNRLWVCNQSDQQVEIINTMDDTIDESVYAELNPLQIAFTGGEAGTSKKKYDDDSTCFVRSLTAK